MPPRSPALSRALPLGTDTQILRYSDTDTKAQAPATAPAQAQSRAPAQIQMRGGRAELSVGNLPTPHGAFQRNDQLDPNRTCTFGDADADAANRLRRRLAAAGCWLLAARTARVGILRLNSEFAFQYPIRLRRQLFECGQKERRPKNEERSKRI